MVLYWLCALVVWTYSVIAGANLADGIWLHGYGVGASTEMVTKGKVNQMPAQAAKLTEGQIHVLASYVWGLSNNATAKAASVAK